MEWIVVVVVVEIGNPLFGLKCSLIALIVEQLQRLLDFLLQWQPMITISQNELPSISFKTTCMNQISINEREQEY